MAESKNRTPGETRSRTAIAVIGALLSMTVLVAGARTSRTGTSDTDQKRGGSVAQLDAVPADSQASPTLIASKRNRDLMIELTSTGKLTAGENSLCVVFKGTENNARVDMSDVTAEFFLLVGRIQERPIKAVLGPEGKGRYCGHLNFGRLYYSPSSYYVFVRYVDAAGKKRRTRLFVAVK
jgi:hypothetical protein